MCREGVEEPAKLARSRTRSEEENHSDLMQHAPQRGEGGWQARGGEKEEETDDGSQRSLRSENLEAEGKEEKRET